MRQLLQTTFEFYQLFHQTGPVLFPVQDPVQTSRLTWLSVFLVSPICEIFGLFYFLFSLSFLPCSFLLSLLFHDDTFQKCYLVVIGLPCWLIWRRQWHPTAVLLPGKSHGQWRLVGCRPWGREESDTTERLPFHFSLSRIQKKMAAHSSVLAWRIPGTGEPGELSPMGSHRVGHD